MSLLEILTKPIAPYTRFLSVVHDGHYDDRFVIEVVQNAKWVGLDDQPADWRFQNRRRLRKRLQLANCFPYRIKKRTGYSWRTFGIAIHRSFEFPDGRKKVSS